MAIISCEHGGHRVPSAYGKLFLGQARLLASHRGWDPGTLELARKLARSLDVPVVCSDVTRLLIDLNRSPTNPSRFSNITTDLPETTKQRITRDFYTPYRSRVERLVRHRVRKGACVHLSIHSFTPVLRGVRRTVDLGVLFDPSREFEEAFSRTLMQEIARELPRLRVEANTPYKGTDDGFTTFFRSRTRATRYAGIELEITQRITRRGGGSWDRVQDGLIRAIHRTLDIHEVDSESRTFASE